MSFSNYTDYLLNFKSGKLSPLAPKLLSYPGVDIHIQFERNGKKENTRYYSDGTIAGKRFNPATDTLLRFGSNGHDSKRGVAFWSGADIDSNKNHKGKKSLSQERLADVFEALSHRKSINTTLSTSGEAFHPYTVFSKPIKTDDPGKLGKAVVKYHTRESGHNFEDDVDKAGGIMWLWTSDPKPHSFKMMHEATVNANPDDIIPLLDEVVRVDAATKDFGPINEDGIPESFAGMPECAFENDQDYTILDVLDEVPNFVYENAGNGRIKRIGTDQESSAAIRRFSNTNHEYITIFSPELADELGVPEEYYDACPKSKLALYALFGGERELFAEWLHDLNYKYAEPDIEEAGKEFEVVEVPKVIGNYGFDPVPIRDLMRQDLKLEYAVEGAFVGEGACFIGGREKCFKTGVVADLLVSLTTGEDFLGAFTINRRMSSALFTAEIGMPSAQNLFRRIAEAKGFDPMALDGIDIVDTIPSFTIDKRTGQPANIDGIRGLKRYLDDRKPEIAVFDPLYFAMGGSGVGDMYEIGAVLKNISEICRDRGVWAIYCHHARKGSAEDEGRPMQLTDLYGAGVGAYARQWLLLSHAEPFRNGVANLYMSVGGSAQGDRGLWNLTIDEGVPDDILGRGWKISTSKDDDGAAGGELGAKAIEDAIELLGGSKGANIKDIRFMLNNPSEAALKNKLRDMVRSGVLAMLPGQNFERREEY